MSREILTRPAPPADTRIAYGPDPLHFGELRLPPGRGPHPVAIAIHGGFWRALFALDYMGHVCKALSEAGMATWNIEFRRIGNAGGGWPGTFQDVALAADYVRALAQAYPLDLARVIAIGHSAGGQLALWLAARQRIPLGHVLHSDAPLPLRAAVSLAGVNDLRRAWELKLSDTVVEQLMGVPPAADSVRYAYASPIEMLPIGVKQILIHGTHDNRVPYEISERYYQVAASKGDNCTLVTLSGAGHFEVVDPQAREWPLVLEAVQQNVLL